MTPRSLIIKGQYPATSPSPLMVDPWVLSALLRPPPLNPARIRGCWVGPTPPLDDRLLHPAPRCQGLTRGATSFQQGAPGHGLQRAADLRIRFTLPP